MPVARVGLAPTTQSHGCLKASTTPFLCSICTSTRSPCSQLTRLKAEPPDAQVLRIQSSACQSVIDKGVTIREEENVLRLIGAEEDVDHSHGYACLARFASTKDSDPRPCSWTRSCYLSKRSRPSRTRSPQRRHFRSPRPARRFV